MQMITGRGRDGEACSAVLLSRGGRVSARDAVHGQCPRLLHPSFFHPDCTVGPGVSPDHAACAVLQSRSWAVPPIGNWDWPSRTLPRRFVSIFTQYIQTWPDCQQLLEEIHHVEIHHRAHGEHREKRKNRRTESREQRTVERHGQGWFVVLPLAIVWFSHLFSVFSVGSVVMFF
jgi:hypothetical protein